MVRSADYGSAVHATYGIPSGPWIGVLAAPTRRRTWGGCGTREWGGGGGAFVLRPFLVDTSILSVLDDDPTEDVEDVEPCKENIFTVDFHSTNM